MNMLTLIFWSLLVY